MEEKYDARFPSLGTRLVYDANCIDSKMINLSLAIVMAAANGLAEQWGGRREKFPFRSLKINEP